MTLHFYEKSKRGKVEQVVQLTFDERNRSRGKAMTLSNESIAWFLPRGEYLRHDDVLKSECGQYIKVIAAQEPITKVTSGQPFLLTRAAYHLGNRHVPLQVSAAGLMYQPDHVLDEMVRGLGLAAEHIEAAFQPEDGAYHSHGPEDVHNHKGANGHTPRGLNSHSHDH